MKKALQLARLRADPSVSERAAVGAGGQPQGDRFFDLFAELFVLDSGRERGRPLDGLLQGRRWSLRDRPGGCRRGLRKVPLDEPEALRRRVVELLTEALEDARSELAELERPDGRARV